MITDPVEIEKMSLKIIQDKIIYNGQPENLNIIKRVIHASADFDYLNNLYFSCDAVNITKSFLRDDQNKYKYKYIIVDTKMLYSGINKNVAEKFNIKIIPPDENLNDEAKLKNTTRAIINIERMCEKFKDNAIYVIGNAPTALIKLCELVKLNVVKPKLIIGVPVGFVNVIESKNLLYSLENINKIAGPMIEAWAVQQ